MKKRILTMATALTLTISASAQVFILENDEELREEEELIDFNIDNPDFGEGTDFYAPIGSGALLLAAMGGAYYLLNKRKEK